MRPAIGAAFGSLSRHLTRNGGRCQSQQAELVLYVVVFLIPPNPGEAAATLELGDAEGEAQAHDP